MTPRAAVARHASPLHRHLFWPPVQAVLRAFFGYFFLVVIVRVVGRRPGRQLTPFEFVLIFFIGGLALTAIVGDERSFTNAACQVFAIALAHHVVARVRSKSKRVARLLDGTALILMERDAAGRRCWRAATMRKMLVQDTDVMFAARDRGHKTLEEIDRAILERNGEVSVLPSKESAE
jgi:uncharacterized membrane protein YcaP (DUF421 family)